MSDKDQEKWISGKEQAEVEGFRLRDDRHETPAGDADADADGESPEVEGHLFRAADAEAVRSGRLLSDKEK